MEFGLDSTDHRKEPPVLSEQGKKSGWRGGWRKLVQGRDLTCCSFLGGGRGSPFQYSCLENPMDRGAWRATVQRVARSQTWLNMHACTPPRGGLTICFLPLRTLWLQRLYTCPRHSAAKQEGWDSNPGLSETQICAFLWQHVDGF